MDLLGKSLEDLFEACGRQFDLKTCCMVAIQMIMRIEKCHEEGIIHRDIKPANIVINHNDEAVLIDFGVSAIIDHQKDDSLSNANGSYLYYAPELF